MNWLLAHLRRRRRRIEETVEVATGEGAGAKLEPPECSRPRLALLVQDAAGPAAYQLHTFSEAVAAAAFIRFWFPPRFQHGIRAFWTAHEEPVWEAESSEERQPEVVILIRDEDRRDIVYPFSCSDMGQARSWIAMEASRGLDLRLVLLYWAVPVRIEADGHGAERFSPSEPPRARRRNGAEAGFEAESAQQEVEEEIEDRGVVSELIDFEAAEPVEDVRPNTEMLEKVHAEPRGEAGMVALEPVEEPAADAPLNTEMLEEVDAEPREAAVTAALQSIEGDGDQSQAREAEEMAEVSVEDGERWTSFVEEDAPGAAEDGGAAQESGWGSEDISPELASFLKLRRWRRSEGPFKGFGSPEGRF